MKWWGWVLIGLVLGAGAVLLWRDAQIKDWQRRMAETEAAAKQLAVVDSLRQLQIDSLLRQVEAIPKDSLDRMTRLAALSSQRAREAAQQARTALGQAATAKDSLDLALVALGASEAHRDTLEAEVSTLRVNLEATGRILALTRQVVGEVSAQRDSARVDAGRWKLRAIEAESFVGTVTPHRLGEAIETGAIIATTVKACSDGVSYGCIAGSLVVVGRVL